jgi:hypothetical protein
LSNGNRNAMLETPSAVRRNLLHWSDLAANRLFAPAPFSMPLSGTLPKTVNARCQQLTVPCLPERLKWRSLLRRFVNEDGPLLVYDAVQPRVTG